MAASDIFFLPSRWEGIALTIYEAMSSGLAVLASDVGGQRELVTPECGILLPSEPRGDQAARHAAALEQLIRDGELAPDWVGTPGSGICASFSIDKMADAVIAAVHQARDLRTARVGRRSPPRRRWKWQRRPWN
jgi:glycosyltransferase involved in cell wall biosynthesis